MVSFLQKGGQLLIDYETVTEFCQIEVPFLELFKTDTGIYDDYAKITKNLRIEDLKGAESGKYATKILKIFTGIEELAVIRTDLKGVRFPSFLRRLTLIECSNLGSLDGVRLHLENLDIENTSVAGATLERLKSLVIENGPDKGYLQSHTPVLENLHLNISKEMLANYPWEFLNTKTLKTITLKEIWPEKKPLFYNSFDSQELRKLTILEPVHKTRKRDLYALPVKKFIVKFI